MKQHLIRIILIFTSVFPACYAQQYPYSAQYTIETGMLSNVTYYGIFDRNNFLWICQKNGLSRFDGTHFTNFTVEDGLPDNDITYITEDSHGTIWAQPFQREPAFLKRNASRFQNINTVIHPDTVKKDECYKVFALKDGKVALLSENGVIRIVRNERLIASFQPEKSFLHYNTFMYETSDGKLVLFRSLKKITIDLHRKTIRKEPFFSYSRVESNKKWICFQDLSKTSAILCLNAETGEKILVNKIRSAHRFGIFKNGLLINQHGPNLSFFDFKTRTVSDVPDSVILAHAVENKEGTVRVLLTAEHGIYVQNQESFLDKQFRNQAPSFFYISNNQVYVSDAVGNVLDLPGNTPKNICSNMFTSAAFAERINETDLVYCNQVIISNDKELAGRAAKMTGVKAIYLLNDSIRYVGTFKGAFVFNNRTRKARTLYYGRVTAISAGPGGSVFIGTIRGLIEITASGKLINWSEKGFFKQIRITDLCFRKDILWVATAGDGLSAIYHGKAKKIIGSERGPSGNHLESIEESNNRELYIAYTNGAQKLKYDFYGGELHLRHLVTLDVYTNEGIRNFFFHSGMMYGLSTNGLYRFDTRKKVPVHSFQLKITRLSVNNVAWEINPHTELEPGKYGLRIEFSTQNYQRLPIQYRYRVNEENWNFSSEGSISLDQLGSGDYQITIQVLNNYNLPSDSRTLTISIAYPFYAQRWFLLTMEVLFLAIVYLTIRYFIKRRYQKLNDRLIQQNKLRELELIALKAQISPHFVFNCLNSIKSLVYQQRNKEADLYIDRFAQLFRNTLESSYEQNYPLSSEINYLQGYLEIEQMSMNYKFDFELLIDPEIDPDLLFIPSMLLQPYVENAVKHGVSVLRNQKGLITVSFRKEGDFLILTVTDNGPGKIKHLNPDKQHLGKGVSITEKRARLFEITTEFITPPSGGTSVILTLKITRKDD